MKSLTFEEAERAIMDARRERANAGRSTWERRFSLFYPTPAVAEINKETDDLVRLLEVLADQDVITVSNWRGGNRRVYAPTGMHLLLWHLQLQKSPRGEVYLVDPESVVSVVGRMTKIYFPREAFDLIMGVLNR